MAAQDDNTLMKNILIANRGEIAVRVIRTAQRLGYETVAVFSDADASAPHVDLADSAIRLGPAEVSLSYMNADHILEAARKTNADAVHPGYGFLAENADFARHVIDAGLTWIGPPPSAMEIMGNKAAAKAALAESGVPLVPGYGGDDQSDSSFAEAANEIGYPVMVKAAAGGGGRGMRLIGCAKELEFGLASARSESLNAFGSDELLLEQAIVNPRHVEVQVFADQHGNTIHLGERDCSIQRRHQKVVEESPGPAVSETLRSKLGQAAIRAAQAVGYTNAGTVEFLLSDDGRFHFIEMNTRLQVEHPVTEMITGFDLVEWQLIVASGDQLPVTQEDVVFNGHAIETRLYAESPERDFLPGTGTVLHWQPPEGPGVRVDHAVRSGEAITPFYDAMIAKIVAHGATRVVAQRRLRRALHNTVALGIDTNRQFLLETINHSDFESGSVTTAFLEETLSPTVTTHSTLLGILAATVLYSASRQRNQPTLNGWGAGPATYRFDEADPENPVSVERAGDGFLVTYRSETLHVQILSCQENRLDFEIDGQRNHAAFAFGADHCVWIQCGDETASFTDTLLAPAATAEVASSGQIVAPMPGSVLRVEIAPGETVEKGQVLLVLEAMKMEQTIEARLSGTIARLLIEHGQQVTPGQVMVVIEPTNN